MERASIKSIRHCLILWYGHCDATGVKGWLVKWSAALVCVGVGCSSRQVWNERPGHHICVWWRWRPHAQRCPGPLRGEHRRAAGRDRHLLVHWISTINELDAPVGLPFTLQFYSDGRCRLCSYKPWHVQQQIFTQACAYWKEESRGTAPSAGMIQNRLCMIIFKFLMSVFVNI